ncbi:unnamed protein product [Penicillium olsonii]|nr:unnamed protein product [Penicillium olsonii]
MSGEAPASPETQKQIAAWKKLKDVYSSYAGTHIINPPQYPKGPDIHTQVKLGDPLTEDNAILARRLWEGPDTHLGNAWQANTDRQYPRAKDDPDLMHVLANNVYEHLMSNPYLPVSRADALNNWKKEKLDVTYDGVKGLAPLRGNIFVNGADPLSKSKDHWTIAKIKTELKARDVPFDDKAKKTDLQRLLHEFELDQKVGVYKRSKLTHWGIDRPHTHVITPARTKTLSALDMYTAAISLSPYNPTYWVSRAYCHYLQGFFDLAIGDAYRAQLLCEVLTLSLKRNLRPGLYTRVWEAIQLHLLAGWKPKSNPPPEVLLMRKANGINYFIPTLRNAIDNIICLSLAAMNCWDDFNVYMEEHHKRGLLAQRDADTPMQRKNAVQSIINELNERRLKPPDDRQPLYGHEWMRGWTSGETRYPYESQDVNREAASFTAALNRNVFTVSAHAKVGAGLCEVRPIKLPDGSSGGLGVFANAAIAAGTIIHYEEPVIRGHLQPNVLGDGQVPRPHIVPRCDNCKQPIPKEDGGDLATTQFCANNAGKDAARNAKSCANLAAEIYAFPEFENCQWKWLHDAMRANITKIDDGDFFTAHNEQHGTVLSLLLKSVLEITLHRRQSNPDLQPHEIDELLLLENGADANQPWGDNWFPFTMAGNIRVPFDILSALGVDIFRDLSFDTWSLQIVLRKLLINAVPWDLARRAKNDIFTKDDGIKQVPSGDEQNKMKEGKEDFAALEPSLSDLYLFPGLSMFNHACRLSENATWGFHTTVPNRVVVYATKAIAKNDEIRVPYLNTSLPVEAGGATNGDAVRLFGKNCNCVQCQGVASGEAAAIALKGKPAPKPKPRPVKLASNPVASKKAVPKKATPKKAGPRPPPAKAPAPAPAVAPRAKAKAAKAPPKKVCGMQFAAVKPRKRALIRVAENDPYATGTTLSEFGTVLGSGFGAGANSAVQAIIGGGTIDLTGGATSLEEELPDATSNESMEGPTSNESMEGPTSNESMEGPTSNESMEGLTSNESMEDPTSNESMEDPTSNESMGNSTSNESMKDPSSNESMKYAYSNGSTKDVEMRDATSNESMRYTTSSNSIKDVEMRDASSNGSTRVAHPGWPVKNVEMENAGWVEPIKRKPKYDEDYDNYEEENSDEWYEEDSDEEYDEDYEEEE